MIPNRPRFRVGRVTGRVLRVDLRFELGNLRFADGDSSVRRVQRANKVPISPMGTIPVRSKRVIEGRHGGRLEAGRREQERRREAASAITTSFPSRRACVCVCVL